MGILIPTAGMKFFIGAAMPSTGAELEKADFPTEWTEIGGTTNHGTVGDTSEAGTSNQIGANRVRKYKGPRNAGSMTLIADLDPADPGQIALIAAEKTKHAYPFKVVFDDAPAGGGTASERYWLAFVMSAAEAYEEASNVIKLNATLEVDSNMVRVAAAPAAP